jgi:hypothetical protein
MISAYLFFQISFIDWFTEKLPEFNSWLVTEVNRISLPNLVVLPPFVMEPAMLGPDGVHLLPASGASYLTHICQHLQASLSPTSDITLVDEFATVDSSSDSDSAESVVASVQGKVDRLDTILKIVKSNSRRLSSVKPLKDALEKLDARNTDFEAQVRIRRARDNLVFARIKEESDYDLNRSRENRVVVSGLDRSPSAQSTHQEKKEHYTKIVDALVVKACPSLEPRPVIVDIIVNLLRNQASPSVEVVFDSVSNAFAFRKAASTLAKAHDPDFTKLYFSNSVTQATRVRIEIMKAIAKKLTTETESAFVQSFISRPILRYLNTNPSGPSLAAGTGRSYSFVDCVSRYGDLVQSHDLISAYKRAGSTFQGALEQYFVVLREVDEQPVLSAPNLVPLGRGGRGVHFTPRGGRVHRGRKRHGDSLVATPSKRPST